MQAVNLALQILVMIAVGIGIRRSGVTNKDFTTRLTTMVLQVCIPCLIFYSVAYPKNAGQPVLFSPENLTNYGVALLLGTLAVFFALLVGQIFYWLTKDKGAARILRYGLTFCTYSFMGIPIMEALFGSAALAAYSFFLIPVRIGYYAFSEALMTPPGTEGSRKTTGQMLRGILLSPHLLAVILGLVFWILEWKLPSFLDYGVNNLNRISTPLALLLCGMLLAEYDLKQLFKPQYFLLPVLRCVMMPALFLALSLLLRQLGVDDVLCKMFVIYAAMPVPSLISIWTVKYEPDPKNHLMAACTCANSMFLCMLTIPLWILILI